MATHTEESLGIKSDHIDGGFRWEIEPKCRCGQLKAAVEQKFFFVSNFTEDGFNQFYMMPLEHDGSLARQDGVQIHHCPWCGDKIQARKVYPKK